jgi:hypothetical protein
MGEDILSILKVLGQCPVIYLVKIHYRGKALESGQFCGLAAAVIFIY